MLVFRFASHIIVLVSGAIFTEGSPAAIAADPGVREVYLGETQAWLSPCSSLRCDAPAMVMPSCSHGISLDLPEHGSLAVLGRNGVGKSTLLMTIMGYTQMRGGRVIWRGQDISRLAPNRRAVNGIGWVAQEREIFPSLSVVENLTVAARPGPWDLDAVFKLFPRSFRAPPKHGQPALRGRAANACDGARADDQPGAHAAGRAVRKGWLRSSSMNSSPQ